MTSLKSVNRRVGSLFAVAALVLATITPGLIPAFASAAQVTERSVTLSNSSKAMPGVDYTVQFTAVGDTAIATVLQFCENSPLIGTECTTPVGFDASGAEADGFTITSTTEDIDNTIIATGTTTGTVTIELEGVNNPTDAGALYLRIVTYSNGTSASGYTDEALGSDVVDQGSAAVSITDTVGVSGAVLETLTFCVAGVEITAASCVGADALAPPTVQLGEEGTGALDALAVSEGSIYSQLSTNAASGAVVSLKSGNDCAGLKRAAAEDCDIAATTDGTGIDEGQARFGIKVAPGGDPVGASGALQLAGGGSPFYSASIFKINYVSGGASGVTSPFGDQVLNTNEAPANSKNAQITFGASISNDTPAGLYANDFSLIATGKF